MVRLIGRRAPDPARGCEKPCVLKPERLPLALRSSAVPRRQQCAESDASHVTLSSYMLTDQILALLIQERDKLNRAIEALQGPLKPRGRPPKNAIAPVGAAPAQRKARTPAQRKAQAKRMKEYWAKRKKEEAK